MFSAYVPEDTNDSKDSLITLHHHQGAKKIKMKMKVNNTDQRTLKSADIANNITR